MLSAVSAFILLAIGAQISLGGTNGMAINLSKVVPARY